MNRWIRYPLLLSGICVSLCPALPAAPAPAPGVSTVTCPANEDRVWVYDSLTTFDVETKLHCGDTVQIVSRVKGYVKVRTASGIEGYMPDSVFPDLPPLNDDQQKLGDHNAAPVETTSTTPTDEPTSLAAVAAAYRAAHQPAPQPEPAAGPLVASTVAPEPVKPTQEATAVSAPQPVAATEPVAQAPVSAPRRSATVAVSVEAKRPVVASRSPAAPPRAPDMPATISTTTTTPVANVDEPPIPAPAAMPVIAPVDASIREIPAKPVATVPDSDEYPDTQPENASANPNCRVFFSAYGLGAEQYKWLSDARNKQFSAICPAPNLQSVDFVILFTHDTDSYVSAMPTQVHTDPNGFSDFDPMTTVDTALMSPTQADKAHYELAWVFHVRRGAFDPATFSPRRRPAYTSTAKGSHASTKAVEDAFNFIEQQPSGR
jgi:hypothetical protein